MEKLELIKNGISNTVATIDTVGGAENVILGDYQRNLILRTKGSVRIQVNNKFYDLINNETSTSEENPNTGVIIVNGSISNLTTIPSDGTLIYTTDPKGLYIVVNGNVVEITDDETGGGSVTGDFISYAVAQTLTPIQIRLAQSNLGLWYSDLAGFSTNIWDKKVSFIESENRHYVNLNGDVVPLYLSTAIGGVVRNGIVVSNSISLNETPRALFYVDSLRSNNLLPITDKYEGLFVGNNGFATGIGINASAQETFINYKPILNFLNGNQEEVLRMENDTMYIGNGVTDHLVDIKGFLEVDKFTFNESLRSKNTVIVDRNTYFNDNIDSKGVSLAYVDDEWLLQVDNILKTSKKENRELKATGQQILSDPIRIINIDSEDATRISIKTDYYSDFMINDLILGLAKNEDNLVIGLFAGKITNVVYPDINDSVQILSIELTNEKGITTSLGYSYMEIVKINTPNILLDSLSNSIIGYLELNDIFDNLYSPLSQNALEDKIQLYFKPKQENIHTLIGNLSNKQDSDFEYDSQQGFYSNNAYIKGKANLNYLKLGDELLFEDGVLTIKDTYRKYGLGVTVAVPYGTEIASGMYGLSGTNAESPINNVSGAILRLQSGASGYQSEVWTSGSNTTSNPKMYIRNTQGLTKGPWSKVYTDSDITATDITNWNTAFGWGNHAGRYPDRAVLSPNGNNSVRALDTRATNPLPSTNLRNGVIFDFKQSATIGLNTLPGTQTYASAMTVASYHDDTGNNYSAFQLAQSNGLLGYRHYLTGAWQPWRKIWTSVDFDPTKFVTLDTEQTISAYKSYNTSYEDRFTTAFAKIKNLRYLIAGNGATQSIKVNFNNPMVATMWEAVIDVHKYSASTTFSTYGESTEIRVTGYNSSAGSGFVNSTVRVTGDPATVSSVKWYRDPATNNISFIIEGIFSSYPKVVLRELILHHSVTQVIINSIRANTTLELSTDVAGLTLLRNVNSDNIDYTATQRYVDNASTLIAVSEGNGVGYRLRLSNVANHGNIGLGAIDLSTSNQAGNNGATGSYTGAFGLNNIASASQSFVAGTLNTVSGANSAAFGQNNTVNTQYSMAIGNGNKIDQSSDTSFVAGSSNTIWQGAMGSIVAGTGNLLEAGGMYTIMAGQTNIATQGTGNALIVGRSNTIKTGSNSIFFGNTNEMNGGGSQSLMGGSNNYFGSGFGDSIIVGRDLTTSSYISESLITGWDHTIHTQASYSIIFGSKNQWYGYNGFVGGVADNLSSGRGGINNTVNATHNTFTFGDSNDNYGRSSTIFGSGLVTNSSLAFTIGVLNNPVIPMTDTSKRDALGKALPAFIVGNGGVPTTGWPTYDDAVRSNAYQLLFDGSSTQFGIAAYGADYSANFTDRSLVDKAYVVNLLNLIVTNNDIEITDPTKGVILRGPDNSRWRLTIDSDGGLGATKLT